LIKLVLIDIDGTLVRDDKTLPAENEEAIKEALQSGVLVTLVTGRNYGAAKEIIDKLQLDVPVVLQNGAFIYRPYSGEVIRKVGLTGDVAKRVIHLCRQEGTFYILYRDFLMQKDMLIDQDYDGHDRVCLRGKRLVHLFGNRKSSRRIVLPFLGCHE